MSSQFPVNTGTAGRVKRLLDHDIEVYKYLRAYWIEHNHAPTIREIKDALEIASTSVVNYRLEKLEEAGHIELRSDQYHRKAYLIGSELNFTPPPLSLMPKIGELVASS